MNIHLGTYARLSIQRAATPTALDAALALWALNHDAKRELWWRAPSVYHLKARLLEAFFRSGYCARVVKDYNADGWLWWLTFCIDGVRFDWHLPPEQVDDWCGPHIDGIPPGYRLPWRLDGGHDVFRATIRDYLRTHGGTR